MRQEGIRAPTSQCRDSPVISKVFKRAQEGSYLGKEIKVYHKEKYILCVYTKYIIYIYIYIIYYIYTKIYTKNVYYIHTIEMLKSKN